MVDARTPKAVSRLEDALREVEGIRASDEEKETIKKTANLKCRELDAICAALDVPPLFFCPECDGELSEGDEPGGSMCIKCGWTEKGEP